MNYEKGAPVSVNRMQMVLWFKLDMRKLLCITALSLFFIGCTSEKPSELTREKPSEAKRSGVSKGYGKGVPAGTESYSLEIGPVDASRNSTLSVIPRGFKLSDAKIEWLVNDMVISSSSVSSFNASETRKGDTVQAQAVINNITVLSDTVKIRNTPPEITKVRYDNDIYTPGRFLGVLAEGRDIDGDDVTIKYKWTKNGEPAGTNSKISVPLKRGDKVTITLIPFDGEDYGQEVVYQREIVNLPPVILENEKFDFNGTIYTYQVKAVELDGDTLAYSLEPSEGMSIDPETGVITWLVPKGFTGKVPVTVSVTDGHGGKASQYLTFTIEPQ